MNELSILGGGPAGLALAFYAHRAGRRFALFERSRSLGGMCRTFVQGRHRFDAGAHRFHDRDDEVTRDVRALLGDELHPVRAPSKVWTRGRLVDFPPTPLNAALSYGLRGAAKIGRELLGSRLRRKAPVSFEDFARARFGETLARGLLLNYSEKLWGLPASQLSPDIATRRLHGMTFRSLLAEMLLPGGKTRHIDGDFLYPRLGYGMICDRLAAELPRRSILTGREVCGLAIQDGAVARVEFSDGAAAEVRGRVVSTLPVTRLVQLLGDSVAPKARESAARLRFRQVRLVFLRLNAPRVTENASIYVPESRYCVSRIYEPKNRSQAMAPESETSLVVEVPCFPGDGLDRLADHVLADRVIDELEDIGLVSRQQVLESKCLLLPFAYPVYTIGYEAEVRVIVSAVAAIGNLDTLGRAGSFYYSHLHDQLRLAKDYVAALP